MHQSSKFIRFYFRIVNMIMILFTHENRFCMQWKEKYLQDVYHLVQDYGININITSNLLYMILRLWYKTEIRSLAFLGIMRVVACDVVVTEIMGFPIPIMAFNTSFHLKRNNPFNFCKIAFSRYCALSYPQKYFALLISITGLGVNDIS